MTPAEDDLKHTALYVNGAQYACKTQQKQSQIQKTKTTFKECKSDFSIFDI